MALVIDQIGSAIVGRFRLIGCGLRDYGPPAGGAMMMKLALLFIATLVIACGPQPRQGGGGDDDPTGPDAACGRECSPDLHSVIDCNGNVIEACDGGNACDPTTYTCQDACTAAEANSRSVGCDYYATLMDTQTTGYCFAVFVANTWTSPAHIEVEYNGQILNTQSFTRIPSGSGPSLTQGTYDAAQGVPPGEVAILFLGGTQGAAPNCPVTPASASAVMSGTGIGKAFRIKTELRRRQRVAAVGRLAVPQHRREG
jgi:hypothetical protein